MPPAKVVARHVVECEVGLVNIDDLQEGFAALRPARQCMERSAEEAVVEGEEVVIVVDIAEE